MDTMEKAELKLKLQKAVNKVINESAEKQLLEDFFYHPELEGQMTEAAWNVLMTAVKNQQYYKENL